MKILGLLQCLAFFSTILIVLASALHDQPLCCGNGSVVLDNDKCQNGQIPLPKCKEVRAFHNVSDISKLTKDNKRTYFFTHSPEYCIGNRTINFPENNSLVVLVCSDSGISMHNITTSTLRSVSAPVKESKKMSFLELLLLIETVLCVVSGLLLAITTLIYFIIPQTQDIEGKCTFHLILMQCFFYFLTAFVRIAQQNELALVNDYCITHWYLSAFIQLCYFMWCAILLHYMWKRYRQNSRVDESKLMNRYRIIGYGIPVLLIALCSIHAHMYSFFTKNDIERVCQAHRILLTSLYGGLPIVIIELICVFFFVCLQRHLWIVLPTHSPGTSTSSIKKFKFRLLMIAKLFTITGLPWLLILFFGILSALTGVFVFAYIIRGIVTFITLEGILLFYILVIDRKHVYRGLADRFGITVRRWERDPDSEESIDYGDES